MLKCGERSICPLGQKKLGDGSVEHFIEELLWGLGGVPSAPSGSQGAWCVRGMRPLGPARERTNECQRRSTRRLHLVEECAGGPLTEDSSENFSGTATGGS